MLNAYINLPGTADPAMDFYEKVFHGANKKIMKFKDAPPNPAYPVPEEILEHVMHGELEVEGTKLFFSDAQEECVVGTVFTLAVTVPNKERVLEIYQELKEGGTVVVAAEPTFFSPMYAFVKDRYGIGWQLISE